MAEHIRAIMVARVGVKGKIKVG